MNLLAHAPTGKEGVLLGIRPEHLSITNDHGWLVQVDAVELLGAERLIYAHTAHDSLTIRVNESLPAPRVGDILHVLPQPGRIHLFDAATGLRLPSSTL